MSAGPRRRLPAVVILGIDPGLAATGYGIVREEGGRLVAIAQGCIRTPPADDAAVRLWTIQARLRELIAEHAPVAAAVEEVYVGPNPRNALAVGQARGAALAACGEAAIPVAEYAVSVIKTAVCGYGRAEKEQVGRMVAAILRLDARPRTEHAADALAAAVCHAHSRRTGGLLAAGARR